MYGGHIRPACGSSEARVSSSEAATEVATTTTSVVTVTAVPGPAVPAVRWGRTVIEFASLKLALVALLLVVGGLLLMRMVMMLGNDN
jgi:hypothetical protein